MAIGIPRGNSSTDTYKLSAKATPATTLTTERALIIAMSHATSRNSLDSEFDTTPIST